LKRFILDSAGRIARHTPMTIRRAFGPAINPVLSRLLAEGSGLEVVTGSYRVRPLRPPAASGPRVLHVIGNFLTGGSSRLVVDLYERLGHRYVQHVVTQVLPTPAAYEGIPVTEIRERDSIEPVLACMRDFRPDLVHVHYWGDCDAPWYERAFEAAARIGCDVIENVNTPVEPRRGPPVTEFVYVSRYVQSTFGVGRPNERTIYPGSNFSIFRPAGFMSRPGTRVGMVYRLEPDKLDPTAIEPMIAAARLAAELRFLVVGGGTFLEEYRRRVGEAGFGERFEFTGYVDYDHLPRLYRDLAVFVAPVWKESFGQVSSFAMNMGIPVVGYDAGAIGEIIDDPTLLAPAGDSAALGRIIAELMRDARLRARIGRRNRERARRLFSVEAMVDEYDRLYASHLRGRA
jgi:glycosyltransferase involved in cell wall biosynthesis